MNEISLITNGYTRIANGMWCKSVEFPEHRKDSDTNHAYKETIVRRSDGSIFQVIRGKKQLSQPSFNKDI